MALLMWHPLFTGKCPHYGQAIAQANVSLQQWHCGSCGTDSFKPSGALPVAMNNFETF
ncbi:hypothetical protein [Stenomitos frigidus]|uniref:hypothetical protein n=1 Tax=Stenomitos frigidus TaxID=1886765 RepID=UPI003297D703